MTALVRLLLVVLVWVAAPASAHETTRSYVSLTRDGAAVTAAFRIAFRDIEVAVWMDEDLDGRITWGEARRRLDAVAAYVAAGFTLNAGGACPLALAGADASASGGIEYLDLALSATCPDAALPLIVASRLFTDIDPDHRMFLTALTGGATTTALLSRSAPMVEVSGDTGGWLGAFASYFRAGVEHLLGGADHIVFLLALILPAVCVTSGGPGQARRAVLGVVAAVTGFTVAHALTLTAATTELLRPPSDLINLLIALSILVTAADNVRPFIPAPRTAVAAFFGIIHGFGFATALGALNLTGAGLATALLGFNLGIEAAQVGVVLLTVPALFVLGGGRSLLWAGSGAAAAVAMLWIWQRIPPLL